MPSLVLQTPTTMIPTDPVDIYLIEPEKIAHNVERHENLAVQEKATRHAIVASYAVAGTQNTWFSGQRGLNFLDANPSAQTQTTQTWIATTCANFEMYCKLSIKK